MPRVVEGVTVKDFKSSFLLPETKPSSLATQAHLFWKTP